jgi:hypothetical protein
VAVAEAAEAAEEAEEEQTFGCCLRSLMMKIAHIFHRFHARPAGLPTHRAAPPTGSTRVWIRSPSRSLRWVFACCVLFRDTCSRGRPRLVNQGWRWWHRLGAIHADDELTRRVQNAWR